MKTGIFLSITKTDKSDITKLEARYRIQSGRLGFDIDDKSEEFFRKFLNKSYTWDFPNGKLATYESYINEKDITGCVWRFSNRTIPSRKIYYHYPKHNADISSYTYDLLPFLEVYDETPEVVGILTSFLDCYEFITYWDAQINSTIYTKNPDFVCGIINKEAALLSIPVHKVNPIEMPVW